MPGIVPELVNMATDPTVSMADFNFAAARCNAFVFLVERHVKCPLAAGSNLGHPGTLRLCARAD